MGHLIYIGFITFAITYLNISSVFGRAACPFHQEFVNATKECPPTCEFRDPPCFIRNVKPQPGCQCKENFIFSNTDSRRCVPVENCPETCSRPHFEYNTCGTRCPITCQQRQLRPCVRSARICQPGCFCQHPYILEEVSLTCVLEKNCPGGRSMDQIQE